MSNKKLLVPLSASSGGGGGGGTKKYLHKIYLLLSLGAYSTNNITICFDLIADVSTPLTQVTDLCYILKDLPTVGIKYGSQYVRDALLPVSSSICMKPASTSAFEAGSEFIPAYLTHYKGSETDHRFYLVGATSSPSSNTALLEHLVQIIQYNATTNTIDTINVKFTPSITDYVVEL